MNIIDIQKLENVKPQFDGSIQCRCAACAESGNDKTGVHMRYWPDTNAFNCVVDRSTSHNKRILELCGMEVDNIPIIIREPKVTTPQIWNKSCLSKLIHDYSYWNKRGIPSEIVEKFDGGLVSGEGYFKRRYVLPCFNEKMDICCFTGRKIIDNRYGPKWLHKGSKNSIYLFPHFAREHIIKERKLIILESPADCMMLMKYGINIGIIMMGLNISSKLMKFLIESNLNHIIISTNNDIDKNSAGNKAAEDIKKKLLNFFDEKRIHVMLPKSKDWGCSSELDILAFKDQIDKLA